MSTNLYRRMADAPPNISIPDWLAAQLRSAGGRLSPRYEASLYGPVSKGVARLNCGTRGWGGGLEVLN